MIDLPTCSHKFTDGTTCNGVALKFNRFCFWHRTADDRRRRSSRVVDEPRVKPLRLSLSRHPKLLRADVDQIIQALVSDRITPRKAGLLLYTLQNPDRA